MISDNFIIHYGTANSGRFKKGSVGNTQKSRELLTNKGKKNNKKAKGQEKAQNTIAKKGNEKLSKISNEEYKKFEKVAQDVIRGKYGNGQARKDAMKKAGYSYDTVQNIVNNKLIGTKLNFSVQGQQSKKTSGVKSTRRAQKHRLYRSRIRTRRKK